MLLMMMLMMLQLLQLLLVSSSNRPPRRLWSCNTDSGGGGVGDGRCDALLGEHGKSYTHTIEYGTMHSREERIMHAEMHKCANVRSTIDVLFVVDCGCCRLILRLQCVRNSDFFSTSTISR